MRAGGYTVHHSLAAEAAAVLKLSLGLARRRGHAQVTPLHVAFTLLTGSPPSGSSSAATAYGLLRLACAKSHPVSAACSPSPATSHLLQCRALELCFNVALNRLPTTSVAVVGGPLMSLPSSSSPASSASSTSSFSASLVQPNPTLSNALVAALKRAQANQRRGCIELQSQQPPLPPPSPEHQLLQPQPPPPPFLALKVELDQLIASILDDPSVSRVMREAGFSSASVKSSLEEESAMLLASPSSSSLAAAGKSQFLLEPYIDFPTHANGGGGRPWPVPAPFLNQPSGTSSCKDEDVTAILKVMARKQGRKTNPVVVGDSVSIAEASVAELMRRLERGDVPDELRGAHVLTLHLSYVHVRLMTRADVHAMVAELRRSAAAVATGGLIIYVGDMRWTVEENDDDGSAAAAGFGFSPADRMVAEIARLLGELRAGARGRAWLLAAASYQTCMRCQRRRRSPPLETAWELQPVVVPAGVGTGLALGPGAATTPQAVHSGAMLGQVPQLHLAAAEEEGHAHPDLCDECTNGYEKELSLVRAKAEGTTLALAFFPGWPQADEPHASEEDELMELRRRWSMSCQSHQHKQEHELTGLSLSFGTPTPMTDHDTSGSNSQDARTTLSLLLPGSATAPEEELPGGEPAALESDDTASSGDRPVCARPLWVDELPAGHVKRKAEGVLVLPLEGKPKRPRDCGGGLDLNFCAAGEENDDGGDSEEEPAPSDLTNASESSGDGDTGRRHDASLHSD